MGAALDSALRRTRGVGKVVVTRPGRRRMLPARPHRRDARPLCR
jgi:hypothetical protein